MLHAQRCWGRQSCSQSAFSTLDRPSLRPLAPPRCARLEVQPAVHAPGPDPTSEQASQPSSSGRMLPSATGRRVRYRSCRLSDVPAVASVCGQAFGFGNFPGIENVSLHELETSYAASIEREVITRLGRALVKKKEAQQEHREFRLQRRNQLMRAQLAALEGRHREAQFPGPESPDEMRAIQRWRRARMLCCLVAEDAASGALLGAVCVSLMQPEAVLPPPFPTNAPLRFYVYNMAVVSSHRRQGLASELLLRCARIGRLWGWDSIWLHVSALNTPAQGLYQREGFQVVNRGSPLAGPLRQLLMCKGLAPICVRGDDRDGSMHGAGDSSATNGTGAVEAVSGLALDPGTGAGARRSGGVFVWRAAADREAGALRRDDRT